MSLLAILFFSTSQCLAVDKPSNLSNIKTKIVDTWKGAGYTVPISTTDYYEYWIHTKIGQFIGITVGFVGIVLTIFIIYAGWLWLSAGGNEEQVTKAKGILLNSLIALAVILGAWVITALVINLTSGASFF